MKTPTKKAKKKKEDQHGCQTITSFFKQSAAPCLPGASAPSSSETSSGNVAKQNTDVMSDDDVIFIGVESSSRTSVASESKNLRSKSSRLSLKRPRTCGVNGSQKEISQKNETESHYFQKSSSMSSVETGAGCSVKRNLNRLSRSKRKLDSGQNKFDETADDDCSSSGKDASQKKKKITSRVKNQSSQESEICEQSSNPISDKTLEICDNNSSLQLQLEQSTDKIAEEIIDISKVSDHSKNDGIISLDTTKSFKSGSIDLFEHDSLLSVSSDRSQDDSVVSADPYPSDTVSRDSVTSQLRDSNEGGEDKVGGDEAEEDLFKVPYYLENFLIILETVSTDDFYNNLFNDEDHEVIAQFNSLPEESQKLYVRLFQRQWRWIRHNKISYPKIAEDLSSILDDLVKVKFLFDATSLCEIDEVLSSLPAPELRDLAKTLRIDTSSQQRAQLIAAILKHSKRASIRSFFPGATADTSSVILKRAKGLLGSCYKLKREPRQVFLRTMMLFGLYRGWGPEDEQAGVQQQLFQMLMSNIGRTQYPEYTVFRETKIYEDRNSLLRFEASLQFEADICEALEKKDFTRATEVYNCSKTVGEDILAVPTIKKWDLALPSFLRAFTAGSVYTRIHTYGVELLQHLKDYKTAVQVLETLLEQTLYCPDYRGAWYDRLALNLDYHLKQPKKALTVIENGLKDPLVKAGRRLALYQRAHRICHIPSNKRLQPKWEKFSQDEISKVRESPKVVIQGRQLPGGFQGPLWVSPDSYQADDQEMTILKRVEDVALIHYRDNGYPHGIHGEGGTFTCLFCLFMWDIIFISGIPDAFHIRYQSAPLDFRSEHFYTARQGAIDQRIDQIRNSTSHELQEMIADCWDQHHDTFCIGLNWERFENVDEAKGLALCMGGRVLAGIFERLAKDMRHTHSGVPDLVVWNVDTLKFKVVEVKGPGDRLSTKQILWIDYLLQLEVDAEVCHVEGVSMKKLRPHRN